MSETLIHKGGAHLWLKMLEDSKACFVVLDPQIDNKLMALLQLEPNWIVEVEDEEFTSFIRNDVAGEKSFSF